MCCSGQLWLALRAVQSRSRTAWSPLIPDAAAYHAVWLAVIGAIYPGFAFADGRTLIVILEMAVATGFLGVLHSSVSGSRWRSSPRV